ncbi:MFS general substrate transporter [Trametes versicolor FP-101664 SS1]|uniref:MFS general substrate transporter n=1 Tax=Trametes versicolor (strain FP-101664) TaxID=717944 RepID=UPI00046224E5|nr:MFS general substrate transporter [Trametes versicolor FP-101664 SS1]EIW52680.1 MFS general substrate transporter [Trametes versicolor FP-101664 SS1]
MVSSATERTPLLAEEAPGVAPPLIESDSTDEVATRTVPNGTDTENGAPAKPQVSLIAVMAPMILGVFLVAMDVTIVTSTYASIGSQFEQLQNTSWIATGYMLSLTSFQPLYGKLSDIFGRKACLIFAYTIFALGCLFCGLARNMTELIAARALAGIGGGGMTTVASIVMSDIAPLRQRGTLQGFMNIAFAAGQATGAPLGGFLADSIGWRWAFLIQVPMTTLAILSVAFGLQLPRSSTGHVREKLARIDFAGAAMLVLSVFTLLLGLDRGGNVAWADRFTAAALAASAIFILAFAAVELRWAREPFAPKRIIANRALLASYLCNLFSSAAAITLVFHISLYLQAVRGASASDVGLILLPTIFGGVAGSLATGLIMQSTGQYYVLTIAVFTLMLIGNTTVALVTGAARYSLLGLIIGSASNNIGYGSGITSTLVSLIANAGPEDQAIATAVSYLFRSLGSVIGLSVGTTLTQDFLRKSLRARLSGGNVDEIVRRVRESLEYLEQLEPAVREKVIRAYEDGLQAAFWFTVALSAITVVVSFFIKEKQLGG